MNGHTFNFCDTTLIARPSGTLHWPARNLLCVSDLHLGKSERIARRGGTMLPPYETHDTLMRLEQEISLLNPETVICLGDSFDDLAAGLAMTQGDRAGLARLMAGRSWVWIEGNHDPGAVDLAGHHLAQFNAGPLVFRHIATPTRGEISGHYHPKVTLPLKGHHISRPCFLIDRTRVIMPAFGTYTGGLRCNDPALNTLMAPGAIAVITGPKAHAFPMDRRKKTG
ncbi:ligase-associated DNA damage response endonuclease PdeM [Oceaniglobus ichthyenteri]|uniref:ligase-associated DNA damage response endonuclease PdeM n=1 Tax=Oceaniglobus ichthyenteri TaxID=2136177 RepID=UPI000D37371D|nr:ligase-associated DNA damage response endonuclease PdeM [Oceaniglobus ichthyenteri]